MMLLGNSKFKVLGKKLEQIAGMKLSRGYLIRKDLSIHFVCQLSNDSLLKLTLGVCTKISKVMQIAGSLT